MLLDDITQLNSEELKKWQFNTRSGIPTAVFGVCDSARIFLPTLIGEPLLYIAKDSLTASKVKAELRYLTGEKVVFLPAKDDVLLYKKFFNKENVYKRVTALYEILNGTKYVVTTLEALMQPFPKTLPFEKIYLNREYSFDTLRSNLVKMGYKMEEFAEQKGTFAIRGDIFEIFPINSEVAYRCDFFGDEIENIREIDENRRSGEQVRSFLVLPCIDFFIEKNDLEDIKLSLQKSFKKFKLITEKMKARTIYNDIIDCLEEEKLSDESLSFIYSLLPNVTNDIFTYFSDCKAIVYDEPKMIYDSASFVWQEHENRYKSLLEGGEAFDFSINNLARIDKVLSTFKLPCHSMQNITATVQMFTPLATIRINSTPVDRYAAHPDSLPQDLENWKKLGYRSIIFCGTAQRAEREQDLLSKYGVNALISEEINTNGIYLTSKYLTNGFILHNEKLVLIGTCDVFLSGVRDKKIKKRRNDTFQAPEVGDFAVHETYGIGIVRGTKKITSTESTKDYIEVEYAGGDFLYVPVENLDRLTKYLGGDEAPQLSKIGGGEFERVKARVRESISKMSINLKKLYRDRATKKGFRFSTDNDLTEEFENSFEYALTEDQQQSVYEIKHDMESDKIMDRLLLGDVGFGKTEVALRAAFKAVMDGKQVAIVAPTTILTEQHFQTVLSRFKPFGITACVLNRFRSSKQIKKYLEQIKNGEIDIIVGTHRIFGKDVVFKDLGLLILDEEQCFGVEHKEKLRLLKSNVDTLTMSATPIPRTLHMSLSGIRDISLILTPPQKRLPVQSYVTEESETLIRDAIMKELGRGGQVFVLYNQVDSIYEFADKIAKLVPEGKIVVGHGQMKKDTLENQIMSFFNGEYNILIATTIIENGIDIPNANTLIVIDADRLGLFTLYQLKGRVGRSDRMAHAYFTYKPDKVLTDSAYKRLSALMEYTELGSGYKIAMRDLEIRGAGNVLGKEQHGHMDKIGYELYSKLLREQLGEVTKDFETEIDIKIDAYIPNDYVSGSSSRLDMYKAISEIKNLDDEQRVTSSIEENYGAIPREVKNLVTIAKIRYMAKKLEIIKVVINKQKASLYVRDINSFQDGKLTMALNNFKATATLSFDVNPLITIISQTPSAISNSQDTAEFLNFALNATEES